MGSSRAGQRPGSQPARRRVLTAGLTALVVTAACSPSSATEPPGDVANCPWVHSTLPIPTRVSMVLDRMTLDEELAMVHGVGTAADLLAPTSTPGRAGATAGVGRLCIPGLQLQDGPAGVGNSSTGVTQLPAPIALALPPTHVFEGMRGILLHNVFDVNELWWALGLNVIYLVVGYVTFSRFLASARMNGTLVQLGE